MDFCYLFSTHNVNKTILIFIFNNFFIRKMDKILKKLRIKKLIQKLLFKKYGMGNAILQYKIY